MRFLLLTLAVLAVPVWAQAPLDAPFRPLDLPTPTPYRAADGRPGPAYWQNRNDYQIAVTLDPVANTVAGTVTLTYTNHSPQPLPYLWLHLEQNLFAPDSRGATGRRAAPTVQEGQGYQIGRVTADGQAVTPTITDTRMRVDLPTPVAANGGRAVVVVPYSFVVPGDQTPRMGRMETEQGPVYSMAQWFPRVAVYDDVNGWNTMPYLGQGEFYLGYGDVEMALTVPADYSVVATGTLLNEGEVYTAAQRERLARARQSSTAVPIVTREEVGTPAAHPRQSGTTTWRYRAENVRDVAWGASRAFLVDAANAAVRMDDGTTNDVLILSAYPAEGIGTADDPGWEEATRYGRASILNNSRWLPYPYPVAISVASHIGGMEYPMLHFSSVSSRHFSLFGVVDHELGHNWFPMIVGSDERRHGWMDEGFNTFINSFSNLTFYNENEDPTIPGYGEGETSRYVSILEGDAFAAYTTRIAESERPILTYPDRVPGPAVGYGLYWKPAEGLHLLREQILGPERFDAAFKTYIRRWAYKHPQPADFFRTMEDVAGEDLDWFWRGWFLQTGGYDGQLTALMQAADRAVATVSYTGLPLPTTVEFQFSDGTSERVEIPAEAFFLGDATPSVLLDGRTLAGATLDPDRALPDADRTNDARTP